MKSVWLNLLGFKKIVKNANNADICKRIRESGAPQIKAKPELYPQLLSPLLYLQNTTFESQREGAGMKV